MALLGEMHFAPTQLDSAFNLPRAGGISLAVQESWVLNQTIRDNILFGSLFDEDRYQKGMPLQLAQGCSLLLISDCSTPSVCIGTRP